MTDEVQQFHKLAKAVGSGEDEHGPYEMIPISMVRGGKLSSVKVHTHPMKHLLKDTTPAPRGWYKPKSPESDRVRARPCYTEALLTTPYGGFCPINCAHCYVNNGTRGYRATGLPVAHYKYPQAMKIWVSKLMVSGAAYITSFSEPFHPLEDTYHITRDLTQVFLDEGLPIFYLSRKIPPDWAMEALLENPYSYMQWSINTSNPDHYRKFSPGSFTLHEVYKAIQRFHDNGIFISIQVNPIIAGVSTLQEIVDLVYELEAVGANHVIFKFVEQVANNRQVIVDRMHQRGLPHVEVFDNLFSQVIGGVYTIQEDVRIEWLDTLLKATRDAQITMSLCYEYWDDGFAGENLAPYYTTADQCHGRGVPIYFRREPGAAFEPLAGCYRKGCLYCLEHGTQACDSDKLLEAGALTYADLRSINIARINEPSWWTLGDSCASPELAGTHMKGRIFGNPGLQTDAEMWDWVEDDNPDDIACGWE